MLSTNYRLRLEFICKCIANGEEVKLDDMIWAEKLGKANTTAREMLKKARRMAANPDMQEGSMDDFMNRMGLGDPDPSNHRTGFESADEIIHDKNLYRCPESRLITFSQCSQDPPFCVESVCRRAFDYSRGRSIAVIVSASNK